MTELPQLEGALSLVLRSSELHDLVTEYAEVGVDAVLESEALREIPIVRTIVGVARAGVSIRDRLFARKLLDFMGPFDKVAPEDRRLMIEKLESDPDYGRKVGDHLIELIDRIDAHKKPKMLSRVFRAYQAGEIDALLLHRLLHAVEQLPAFEIPAVRRFCEMPSENRSCPQATALNMQSAGLVTAASGWGSVVYLPNEISAAFLQLELDRLD